MQKVLGLLQNRESKRRARMFPIGALVGAEQHEERVDDKDYHERACQEVAVAICCCDCG